MVLFYALVTVAALWLWIFVYQGCTFLAARLVGLVVKKVTIGVGPTFWIWKHNGVEWRFRLLPLAGETNVRQLDEKDESSTEKDAPPGSYQGATLFGRILLAASGPLAYLVLGTLLLGLAVVLSTPQLLAEPAERPEQPPSLAHATERSTWQGQLQLLPETVGRYLARLVTFRAMDGWGGLSRRTKVLS
jgi:membrane-associated protease RseP (regulator of RpoE activity)